VESVAVLRQTKQLVLKKATGNTIVRSYLSLFSYLTKRKNCWPSCVWAT